MAKPERETREERLAQALRANLRRRKGQARARAEPDDHAGEDGDGEATPSGGAALDGSGATRPED